MKPSERIYMKSPFENVFNLLNSIPQGHEKALKHALYNAVATLLLIIGLLAGCALFYILEPFVKPLVWALLVGSVLHPFKRTLENRFESWLNHVEISSQPLLLAAVMIPIHFIDEASEIIGSTIRRYLSWLISACVAVALTFFIYTYIPNFFLYIVGAIWSINCHVLHWLLLNFTTTIMLAVTAAYATVLVFSWSEERAEYFTAASYVALFLLPLFIARTIGIFTIHLFILFILILMGGFAYEVACIYNELTEKSYFSALCLALHCVPHGEKISQNESSTKEEEDEKEREDETDTKLSTPKPWTPRTLEGLQKASPSIPRRSDPELYMREKLSAGAQFVAEESQTESWWYIYAVMWACAVILLWSNIWLMRLLPLPIALYIIKRVGYYFGIWSMVDARFRQLQANAREWIVEREALLFPAPIKGLSKLALLLREKFMVLLRESISSFSSTIVILALILFAFLFMSFIILKIYAEGIHLLTVGASVINSTVVHNPEVLQLLPEGWRDHAESMLNNAYIYGREGISKYLRSTMKDVETSKAAELEKHVLEFWDRFYQAWLIGAIETSSQTMGPKVSSQAVAASWNNFMELLRKTPGVLNYSWMGLVSEFLKDNLETLFSLLDSVWALLKGNISLVFHFLFTVVSVVLGGGSAVLNFFLNAIVFFTALFYLLSSSADLYKPVHLISNFSPGNGNKVGLAFESAVNGVFKASFKMALFYGLWTWLIHSLFQVRIVYLPSVLAAMLGAVPFLGTYWASIPAVLDLWLAQDQGFLALLLFVFQCLPMSFVDTAIYMEIRGGGHPYMTGLAIAGGVFCMGIQGAIFGPLLLCCLLVAINMSSNLMKESPTDSINTFRQLRRSSGGSAEGESGAPLI